MESKKIKRGTTLVELLIVTALTSAVVLLLVGVYLSNFRLFSNQNKIMSLSSGAKIASDEIANQIRESSAVVDTCTNCSGDSSGPNILILEIWRKAANGEPMDPGTINPLYDFIVYKQEAFY